MYYTIILCMIEFQINKLRTICSYILYMYIHIICIYMYIFVMSLTYLLGCMYVFIPIEELHRIMLKIQIAIKLPQTVFSLRLFPQTHFK